MLICTTSYATSDATSYAKKNEYEAIHTRQGLFSSVHIIRNTVQIPPRQVKSTQFDEISLFILLSLAFQFAEFAPKLLWYNAELSEPERSNKSSQLQRLPYVRQTPPSSEWRGELRNRPGQPDFVPPRSARERHGLRPPATPGSAAIRP